MNCTKYLPHRPSMNAWPSRDQNTFPYSRLFGPRPPPDTRWTTLDDRTTGQWLGMITGTVKRGEKGRKNCRPGETWTSRWVRLTEGSTDHTLEGRGRRLYYQYHWHETKVMNQCDRGLLRLLRPPTDLTFISFRSGIDRISKGTPMFTHRHHRSPHHTSFVSHV